MNKLNAETLVDRARTNVKQYEMMGVDKPNKWRRSHRGWFAKLDTEVIKASKKGKTSLVIEEMVRESKRQDMQNHTEEDLKRFIDSITGMKIPKLNIKTMDNQTVISWAETE